MTTDPGGEPSQAGPGAARGIVQQLAVPHGYTLTIGGVLAIMLDQRPHPGAFVIWLFTAGAGLGYCAAVLVTGAGRSPARRTPALTGRRLLNLTPALVVPAASWVSSWIPDARAAFATAGALATIGYVAAVAAVAAVRTTRRHKMGSHHARIRHSPDPRPDAGPAARGAHGDRPAGPDASLP